MTTATRKSIDAPPSRSKPLPAPPWLVKLKAQWRDMAMADGKLAPATRVIAYHYADRSTLPETVAKWRKTRRVEVWGTQKDLSKETGFHIGTVKRFFREMQKRGYLEMVARGNQFCGSNRYEILIPETRKASRLRTVA